MTLVRHVEIMEKLEAYALGQLPEQDRRDVDAHLNACAVCTRELDALNTVLAGIGESVPAKTPPPALRSRVLEAIAKEPQDRPAPVPIAPARQPRRIQWALASLGVAAALLLAVGLLAFRSEQSRRQLAADVSQLQERNAELVERVQRYNGQADLALSILTAADMREIPLTGQQNAANTAARAYWSPERGLLVVADRLPAAPPGRIYQVWVIENKVPISAGLLDNESPGRGMLIVTPPRPGAGGMVTVAVSDEPPGGREAPSGSIHLLGSI